MGSDVGSIPADIGIPSAELARSIYHPDRRPPYYAIRHQGGTLISVAGLAVDGGLRVIRPDGSPIRGLYAAGELLGNGSLSGQAFCAGMMVTPALALGCGLGMHLPVGGRG